LAKDRIRLSQVIELEASPGGPLAFLHGDMKRPENVDAYYNIRGTHAFGKPLKVSNPNRDHEITVVTGDHGRFPEIPEVVEAVQNIIGSSDIGRTDYSLVDSGLSHTDLARANELRTAPSENAIFASDNPHREEVAYNDNNKSAFSFFGCSLQTHSQNSLPHQSAALFVLIAALLAVLTLRLRSKFK